MNHSSTLIPSPAVLPSRLHHMVTRSHNNIHCPKSLPDGMVHWPKANATVFHSSPPESSSSVAEALKYPEWREAMAVEITTLCSTNTWLLVPPSSSQNVLGTKWVFRVKRKADGSVDRYKARLVAKGYHQ